MPVIALNTGSSWPAGKPAASQSLCAGDLIPCSKTPSVLGNAMPKSGSHLINQVVQGLTRLGPFVNPGFPPVNRDEVNEKLPDDANPG